MRFKHVVSPLTLAAFLATMSSGCGGSDEIRLAPAPPVTPVEAGKPVPKKREEGGGPASSGNSKMNPGASD
jgi:hypothetical protein